MPSFSKKLTEARSTRSRCSSRTSTRKATGGGSVAAGFKPDDTKLEDCKADDFHCYEQAFANISYKRRPEDGARHLRREDQDARPDRARLPPDRARDRRRSALSTTTATSARHSSPAARAAPRATTTASSSAPSSESRRASSAPRPASSARAGGPEDRVHRLPVRPRPRARADDLHGLRPAAVAAHLRQAPEQAGTRPRCTGGVFMENYQSSYGVTSRWLKNKDLLYPCDAVAEKYKFYCYDLVTARILPKVNYNWKKTAAWCRRSETRLGHDLLPVDGPRRVRLHAARPGARSSTSAGSAGTWPRSASTRPPKDMAYTDVSPTAREDAVQHAPRQGMRRTTAGRDRRDPRLDSTARRRSARRAATRRRSRADKYRTGLLPRRRDRTAAR